MEQRVCIVCGKRFDVWRVTQRYCSAKCRRYANRHDELCTYNKDEEGEKVLWSFSCVKCGKIVEVRSPNDRRTKFCSRRCEKLYWKHSRYVRPKAVAREFDCRMCGTHVCVTEAKDHRRCFCSPKCSIEFYMRRTLERQKRKTEEKRKAREAAKKETAEP